MSRLFQAAVLAVGLASAPVVAQQPTADQLRAMPAQPVPMPPPAARGPPPAPVVAPPAPAPAPPPVQMAPPPAPPAPPPAQIAPPPVPAAPPPAQIAPPPTPAAPPPAQTLERGGRITTPAPPRTPAPQIATPPATPTPTQIAPPPVRVAPAPVPVPVTPPPAQTLERGGRITTPAPPRTPVPQVATPPSAPPAQLVPPQRVDPPAQTLEQGGRITTPAPPRAPIATPAPRPEVVPRGATTQSFGAPRDYRQVPNRELGSMPPAVQRQYGARQGVHPIPTPAPVQRNLSPGRYYGRDFPTQYRNSWSRGHRNAYPYWYSRSFDHPLSYGYYPYPYSRWDVSTRRYYYDPHYPSSRFSIYPGIQIGLPPLGFGVFYDLYWRPTDRTYLYQPRVVSNTQQPVEAGLRVSRNGEVIRLSWADSSGRSPRQVNLFLADREQTVLASQTLVSAPYVSVFEPPRDTAFIGVTVEWSNGSLSTALLPYAH